MLGKLTKLIERIHWTIHERIGLPRHSRQLLFQAAQRWCICAHDHLEEFFRVPMYTRPNLPGQFRVVAEAPTPETVESIFAKAQPHRNKQSDRNSPFFEMRQHTFE